MTIENMNILIIGGSSLLGRYMLMKQPMENLQDVGSSEQMPKHKISATYNKNENFKGFYSGAIKLDASEYARTAEVVLKNKPDVIIHLAANGNVDSVERDPTEAIKSDLMATVNLVEICKAIGIKLVTVSTNAVFDGSKSVYYEESERNPLSMYGMIKSLADDIVQKQEFDWIIIRPILLYGRPYPGGRGNWVTKLMESEKPMKIVNDVLTQPTYAGDAAEAIWHLIENNLWREVYNVCCPEMMTLYDFAGHVCDVFELDKNLISPCKLFDFTSLAPRPLRTTLSHKKLKDSGFVLSKVQDGLLKMKEEE